MKKYIKLIMILLFITGTISCFNMIGDLYDTPPGDRPVIWKDVGKLSIAASFTPKLIGYNGKLFAAWVETSNIHVKYFNGDDENPLWTQVNLPCNNGNCSEPFLAVYGSKLFITYIDNISGTFDVYVKTYNNDGTWSAPIINIEEAVGNTSSLPKLTAHWSDFYITWIEAGLVRMKKYNGGTSWIWDGLTDFTTNPNGINDNAGVINTYSLASSEKGLFAALDEGPEIKVRWFGGSIWGTILPTLRFDTGAGIADSPSLKSVDGQVYLSWAETTMTTYSPTANRISAMRLDQAGWVYIDGNTGKIGGLKYYDYTVGSSFTPMVSEINNKLFAVWIENDGGLIRQLRASLYDADDGTWDLIDGKNYNGLNYDPFNNANAPYTIQFDSKIYIIYLQFEGVDVVRVLVGK